MASKLLFICPEVALKLLWTRRLRNDPKFDVNLLWFCSDSALNLPLIRWQFAVKLLGMFQHQPIYVNRHQFNFFASFLAFEFKK